MKHALTSIKQVPVAIGTTVSFVVLALFGFGSLPSLVAQASAAPPPCPSGYFTISDPLAQGGQITGQGVNNPVDLTSSGNCFHNEHSFTYAGNTGWEYVNGSGHCLWVSGGTVEVGSSDCVAGHTNEEFVGTSYIGGQGWTVINVTTGVGDQMAPVGCSGTAGAVIMTANPPTCNRWNF